MEFGDQPCTSSRVGDHDRRFRWLAEVREQSARLGNNPFGNPGAPAPV
jgi:hypothetical protein